MTPDDVELGYFEVDHLADFDGLPDDYDAVAISSFSAQMKDAYVLADQFRAASARVILGGLHVTARPDEALQHAVGPCLLSLPVSLRSCLAGRRFETRPHSHERATSA